MASAGSIFVDLLLRDAQFNQGINRARNNSRQGFGAIKSDSDAATRAISSGWNSAVNAVKGFAAALGVREVSRLADTWSDLSSRVGLASGGLENAAGVMDRLAVIARRTYSSLENTTEGFLRNSTALRELGYNTDQALDFIESINNALVVSGAKGQTATAVMNNLNQAMALGTLQGQNLNFILQSGGRITELLAEELGVATTELRQLGRDGKITGDVIFNTLTKNMEKLIDEAESMPATIGDGFIILRNSLLQTVGVFDQANGLSESLAKTIILLADNLNVLANIALTVSSVFVARMIPGLAASAIQFAASTRQAILYQSALASMAGVSRIAAVSITGLSGALALVGGPLGAAFLAAGAAVYYFSTQMSAAEKVARDYQAASSELEGLYSKLTYASSERSREIRKEIAALYDLQVAELAANEARLSSMQGRSDFVRKFLDPVGIQENRLLETIEAQRKALRDFEDRALSLNNRDAPNGRVSAPQIDEKAAKKRLDELNRSYEKYEALIKGISQEQLNYQREEAEIGELFKANKISLDEYTTALFGLDEKYDELAKKADQTGVDMEQFGKRAAENIQDAFADFLFDPFDQGLKGMAKGFIDTIRRMIAEAQAAKLAQAIFGEVAGGEGDGLLGGVFKSGGDFLGGLFDGFFADGGHIQPGHFGVAGEAGAELIYGGKSGATVIPQSKMGGGNVYQIDARGADKGAVARMEQALMALAGPGVIENRVQNAQKRGSL